MLHRTVREAARRWGDATCLVAPAGWSVSYREVDEMSDEVAAGLLAVGLGDGSVIASRLPASPDHVVAFVAAAKVGAVFAGVNQRLTGAEQEALLDLLDADLVLGAADAGTSVDTVLRRFRRGRSSPPELVDDLDRPVAIVFTSGTTGTPRGAVYCNRQIEFITRVDTGGEWGGGGHAIGSTALSHLGPTTKLEGNVMRGGTTHLVDRWRPGEALRMTAEFSMTSVAGIPTQVALMLRHPDFDRTDLSSVRAVVMGGGPATPELVRDARSRLGAAVAVRYSCTEAGIGLGTAFTDPPEDAEVSVGRPHAGVELSLRDPGSGAIVPDGEIGEVCLRSPAQMSGYWRDPAATAAALTADGFVRTGDLGRLDEAGRLQLAGRAKEMYVRGGYNVHPMEVEAVLATHPSVADVAIVARSDDVMGEIGVAVVVAASGQDPPSLDDLRAHAAVRLAHHKLPEALVVVDALPLTAMDKVDKRELARRVAR